MDMDIRIMTGWWIFKRVRTFRGSSTVWHDIETGERASSRMESKLSQIEWMTKQQKKETKNDC